MTVKEFSEYLLNNFDHNKEIVKRKAYGDYVELEHDDCYDDIDIDFFEPVKNHKDKVIIL